MTYHGFRGNTLAIIAFGVTALAVSSASWAERLPEFELGIGPGAIYQNYYPGTKDTRSFAFPAIIPIYRGERLKSDEEGVRAELAKDSRFRLDLSVELNLSIDSDDIVLRQGMPDIDNILQIGPSLQYTFSKSGNTEWMVRLPVRAGISIGDSSDSAGITFGPDITYLREMRFFGNPWRLGLSLGPQFGTAEYHDTYYAVDDQFVTPTRAAYQPDGGLSNIRFLLTFTSKTPKRITSWFLRAESLSGSAIEDSPLVETNNSLTAGFIYSFMVFKSKRMVEQ